MYMYCSVGPTNTGSQNVSTYMNVATLQSHSNAYSIFCISG